MTRQPTQFIFLKRGKESPKGRQQQLMFLSLIQNLLYFSTMNTSRVAKLFCHATARYALAQRILPSFWTLNPTYKSTLGLSTSFKFKFSSSSDKETSESQSHEEISDFEKFITDENVLKRLKDQGITKMFPIQFQTFKWIESGKDVLASDRTGSGKTLGYTLPVLQMFNVRGYKSNIKAPKFLILCPTRQLTLQVSNEINKFNATYKVVSVYGGSSIDKQISELGRGAAIVVATPGRLIDLIGREAIVLKDLEVVCLDEADTMLEKGFKDDVQQIFSHIKAAAGKTQNIMFSATMPSWVIKIAKEYFDKGLKRINMIKDEAVRTSETVEHLALYVRRGERHKTIRSLIEKYNPKSRTIIFTQTKAEANEFLKEFDGNNIVILHGDIPQANRQHNLREFRNGNKRILIATDVAARGIDIPDVELIIQLSPPENPEPYIHRSGRTGRAGKEGVNITFFDERNIQNLIEIERAANIKIKLISDGHNITFWYAKLRKILHKVSHFKSTPSEAIYQHFVDEILKSTDPKTSLLYFIKELVGAQPVSTSVLTQKQGFVTYFAFPSKDKKSNLSQTFSGITIHNESPNQEGIQFDISSKDFLKFEEMIEKQEDFEIEIADEYSGMTLQVYARKHAQKFNISRRVQRGSRDDWDQRNNRSQRREREVKNEGHTRQEKSFSKRDSQLPPEGLSSYKVFIYGFSPDVEETQMKEEIMAQAEINDFRLRIVRKQDEDGNIIKTFGFVEFKNRDDCINFCQSTVEVNGKAIKKQMSVQRKQ